ncbi:flagellar L-ring protein precursor FlgH [Hasllibacter halocynthiae]|uniref:Flagellar L-ring protein n=1 Tax=Hasllibacter halocynthiae TaxID=595589 RepID=A0A2T0X2M7_9RHOB|nr:flagellar basal body L-ring protein FlgH [Hasllibacter halocynthiae]PRY93209.1 flagellar L-ring protein precursor FlgH [Hasllibacter halocynthiae]
MRGALILAAGLAACAPIREVGRAPVLTSPANTPESHALTSTSLAEASSFDEPPLAAASTWAAGAGSLLDLPRARGVGDIVTVVIEIDDEASIESDARRSRSDRQQMGVDGFLGLPERAAAHLPAGASLATAVDTSSSSGFDGSGRVSRAESLELRVAAVVTAVTQSGALAISGTQEVRVNAELRELTVSGFVRPEDISRRNEIPSDRIAAARIGYGGRGRVSEVQQPRYGAQLADRLLPF